MKRLLLVLFFISIIQAQNNNTKTGTLYLSIDGFENNDGKVMIAVGNSEENYSDHDAVSYKGVYAEIKNQQASYTFKDLPYGFYAIKIFHDENDNDELDSNFMHIPQEAYGFSNNARGTFGPASWDDAKFELKDDSLAISITVE